MTARGPASLALRAALAFGACLALLLPSAARAGCLYLDVTSSWTLHQSNGPQVDFVLQQTDGAFQGDALTYLDNNGILKGAVSGSSSGDALKFTIRWADGSVGEYDGGVKYHRDQSAGGRDYSTLEGSTFDVRHSGSPASWHSNQTLKCLKDDGANSSGNWGPWFPPPPVALGRVNPPAGSQPGPPMTICERARDARARSSPVAASLEAQCVPTALSKPAPPAGTGVALQTVPSTNNPPAGKNAICALAASARARNSPSAAGLEAQCRALAAKP